MPSLKRYVKEAATTWPRRGRQIVHLSNGLADFADPRHSDVITQFPSAYRQVPRIEVEPKGKECVITTLRQSWSPCRPV